MWNGTADTLKAKPTSKNTRPKISHRLPTTFSPLAALATRPAVIEGLHSRRFVHLDLHQKRNVLIGPTGEVWLIDLGQGVDCSRGLLRRLAFPWLAHIDRKATVKFRARYAADTLPDDERERRVRDRVRPDLDQGVRRDRPQFRFPGHR